MLADRSINEVIEILDEFTPSWGVYPKLICFKSDLNCCKKK
jgi:hypothetical protein